MAQLAPPISPLTYYLSQNPYSSPFVALHGQTPMSSSEVPTVPFLLSKSSFSFSLSSSLFSLFRETAINHQRCADGYMHHPFGFRRALGGSTCRGHGSTVLLHHLWPSPLPFLGSIKFFLASSSYWYPLFEMKVFGSSACFPMQK